MHRPHHSCNQAKYPQDASQQKLSILLLKPRRSTICRHIGCFDKIYTKSSKNSDLLATLVKNLAKLQIYICHASKNLSKKNALYTPHKILQASVNLPAC
ncbi:hypothetical protein [Campylobacter concisus]|uniref:hypothetical protein n=1 Tax=Campylobacter concisus TaxID=199 RepID=UPI00122C8D9D|nr:hypothetical protein [Campylobacter concisus]